MKSSVHSASLDFQCTRLKKRNRRYICFVFFCFQVFSIPEIDGVLYNSDPDPCVRVGRRLVSRHNISGFHTIRSFPEFLLVRQQLRAYLGLSKLRQVRWKLIYTSLRYAIRDSCEQRKNYVIEKKLGIWFTIYLYLFRCRNCEKKKTKHFSFSIILYVFSVAQTSSEYSSEKRFAL